MKSIAFFAFSLIATCYSFKSFQTRVPNGHAVPHPCKPNFLWKGLGHINADGGGKRNPFGLAFKAAGLQWTPELCKADSDGDGRTNGEELGDPQCTWKQGQQPDNVKDLSHPGVCEPFDSPLCLAKNAWVQCESKKLDCPAFKEKDVRTLDVVMKNVSVPRNQTYYMCHVVDVPTDRDYHMIGLTPLIDNEYVIHHSTIMGCASKTGGNKFDTGPAECGMTGFGEGCGELVGVWTLGSPGHCFHSDLGMLIGKNGIKRLIVQNHYTNPEGRSDWYDASGVRIYYTTKLRKYEGGTWTIGQSSIEIPPQQRRVDVIGRCPEACTRQLNHTIYIVDGLMHAHYLGTGISVRHERNKQNLGYIVNEDPYSYDNPIFHALKQPVAVHPGDELITRCSYQSMNRAKHTSWGLGTYDEMCYAIFFYYPKLRTPDCTPWKEIADCEGFTHNGCDNKKFLQSPEAAKSFWTLPWTCKQCTRECAQAIRTSKSHPCLQGVNLEYQRDRMGQFAQSIRDTFKVFHKMEKCSANDHFFVLPVVGKK